MTTVARYADTTGGDGERGHVRRNSASAHGVLRNAETGGEGRREGGHGARGTLCAGERTTPRPTPSRK